MLEVVVALTVLALTLGTIYAMLSSSMKRNLREAEHQKALNVAIVIMEEIGVSKPLENGEWSNETENGLQWSITIKQEQAEESNVLKGKLFTILVEVSSSGFIKPLVSMQTFRIATDGTPS